MRQRKVKPTTTIEGNSYKGKKTKPFLSTVKNGRKKRIIQFMYFLYTLQTAAYTSQMKPNINQGSPTGI